MRNYCKYAAALLLVQGYCHASDNSPGMRQLASRAGDAFSAQTMLDDQTLDARRGGTEVVSEMDLNGTVSDNQAYNLTTGGNSISGGAFAGASGIPTVIQNSGNNVLIQNATIVNVQMQ